LDFWIRPQHVVNRLFYDCLQELGLYPLHFLVMNNNPDQIIFELKQKIKDLEYQLKIAKDNSGY